MKAFGYIRVSTNGHVMDGISLDAQESKIRARADLHRYALIHIYQDRGISGSKMFNREGLQRALNDIGKGDALIVYFLSRPAWLAGTH